MRTIEGLEIDYLRDQLRRVREQEEILIEEIYQWIMANEDMDIGESADALFEAQKIVKKWKAKCKI
jgi:hypothetical protein